MTQHPVQVRSGNRRRDARTLTWVLLVLLPAPTACATTPEPDDTIPLTAGQRVRITLTNRVATGPVQGTLMSVAPDTLVIAREEGGERRLSRNLVQDVEVSVSRTVDPMRAGQYGILAAAPLLLLAVLFAPVAAGESYATTFAIIFVPVAAAAAVGAAIGSGAQDVWVEASWLSDPALGRSDSLPLEP